MALGEDPEHDRHRSLYCKPEELIPFELSESNTNSNIPETLVPVHSSGRRKNGNKSKVRDFEGKDEISNLPDAILTHILSLIPTKYAVRTSILSTRWRSMWTLVPNLHFNTIRQSAKKSGFMDFVERVLLLHNVSNINKFHLGCHSEYNPLRINSWVSTAIKRNVQELVLSMGLEHLVELPRCLFTSANLVVLKLHGGIVFHFPMPVSLPRLNVLQLCSLEFLDDDSFKNLLSGCPALEELDIRRNEQDDIKTLHICSLTLKKLYLYNCFNIPTGHQYGLVIKAPALEFLCLTDHVSENIDVDELPALVEAKFDVLVYDYEEPGSGYPRCVVDILGKVSRIQHLCLSNTIFTAIKHISCPDDHLPSFNNLTLLEITIGRLNSWISWSVLLCLLGDMPIVRVLVLNKEYKCGSYPCLWRVPKSVPRCLLFSLDAIEFRGFEGCKEEMDLVRYLLGNAMVLKKLTISSSIKETEKQTAVLKKLLMFPRGSTACQIEFC